MKKLLSFCLCTWWLNAAAQELPVHRINGADYYLHQVEAGNTLYGIARTYGVSADQVMAHNKEALAEGLREHQTLLIPVVKKPAAAAAAKPTEHTVAAGETLYAIAKKYGLSLEQLLAWNNGVPGGAKTGQVLRLTAPEMQDVPDKQAAPNALPTHKVEAGQTLFSLAKHYGTTVDELNRLNQGLPAGLQLGALLVLPESARNVKPPVVTQTMKVGSADAEKSPDAAVKEAAQPAAVVEKPTVNAEKPAIAVEKPAATTVSQMPAPTELVPNTLKVALLLPFQAHAPDSGKTVLHIDEAARAALSYYRGFSFGVDSMAKAGRAFESVCAIDLNRDSIALQMALQKPCVVNADVVVGPFYTEQFTAAASALQARGVTAVCPVQKPSKMLFKHPNAAKTIASDGMQLSSLAAWLAKNYRDSTLVLVNANKYQNQDELEFFKAQYAKAAGVPDTFTDDAIREAKLWDVNRETLQLRFGEKGSYTLIVPTDNAIFLTRFFNGLHDFWRANQSTHRFTVIGLESWLKREQDMEMKHLHDLHITLPLSGYLNHADSATIRFVTEFAAHYEFEPDAMAAQGFDLACALATAGNAAAFVNNERPASGVFHPMRFKRVMAESGAENEFIGVYQYRQFRLKKIGEWPQSPTK